MSSSGVEITLRDVYEQVVTVGAQVTALAAHQERVDARLDSGGQRIKDHEARIRLVEQLPRTSEQMKDFEDRMRALERFRFKIAGAGALAGALTSVIGALVDYALTHH